MRLVLSMLGDLAGAILRGMMLLVGFVTNSSTFPQPLGEEEEARYLARLQEGDEDARAVLIERNLRLVAHIVNTSCVELQVAKRGAGDDRLLSCLADCLPAHRLVLLPWSRCSLRMNIKIRVDDSEKMDIIGIRDG